MVRPHCAYYRGGSESARVLTQLSKSGRKGDARVARHALVLPFCPPFLWHDLSPCCDGSWTPLIALGYVYLVKRLSKLRKDATISGRRRPKAAIDQRPRSKAAESRCRGVVEQPFLRHGLPTTATTRSRPPHLLGHVGRHVSCSRIFACSARCRRLLALASPRAASGTTVAPTPTPAYAKYT